MATIFLLATAFLPSSMAVAGDPEPQVETLCTGIYKVNGWPVEECQDADSEYILLFWPFSEQEKCNKLFFACYCNPIFAPLLHIN